jgi:dTDP-4-amino-4,6-dideoxygalactose transaminase
MSDPIGIVDFEREVDTIGDSIKAAMERVVDSGWFVLGSEVESFEEQFADYTGTDYCIGVNSGTDAIELGLRALGVGPGDEVITVAHTATATAAGIMSIGAEPVYVDVDPQTMVMDADAAAAAITDRTAAIVPVHLYGQPVDLEPLLSADDDVAILEDCSQAHGATYRGRPVGSIGDIGAFSFYPTKNLGAYGDGGAVVTDDQQLARRVDRLRQYGWERRYDPESWGRNSRLDELQAAVLDVKLDRLSAWNDRRREIAERYDELLANTPVETPTRSERSTHVFHQYVVRSDRRDSLREHLARENIDTLVHYPTPVHRQDGYRTDTSLPVTERLCERIVSIPVHPFLTESDVDRIAATIAAFDG